MFTQCREGICLAFEDSGGAGPAMVFVHGLGCDHTFLSKQAHHFEPSRRVISVDLRGHGASDAPKDEYTMSVFCNDLAWLCKSLALEKTVLVGHSMGGNIALMMSGLYPELLSAIVMLDSVLFPSESLITALEPLNTAMAGDSYLAQLKLTLAALCLPSDMYTKHLLNRLQGRRDVLASALLHQLSGFDSRDAASKCQLPAAYIAAATPLANIDRLRVAIPQLFFGATLGAGHFAPFEVPKQVNAMIERFLEIVENAITNGSSSAQ